MPSRRRSSSSASAPTAAGWFRARHPMRSPGFYQFWRVGTWEPGLRIDQEPNAGGSNPPAFTGDGRLMALGIAPDQVLLADAATGRELARLTTLQPVTPTPLVFSPDGTKLVARTEPEDRAGVGPAADPRPARADGAGLGRSAVPDCLGCERRRWPGAPAEAGTGRRRSHRAPGAARRRIGRDEPPARRQARRCRSPDPPRLAVHPAEEVARSDRRPRASAPAASGRFRCLLAPGRGVPGNGQPGRRTGGLQPPARTSA